MKRVKLSGEYYVYIIFDNKGIPCYIGKGKGDRWEKHFLRGSHNKRLNRLIRKQHKNLPVVVIKDNMWEVEAYNLEMLLISIIGRDDLNTGPLYNLTPGGEGGKGGTYTIEHAANIAKALKGKPKSLSHRESCRKAWIGVKRGKYNPKQGRAISASLVKYWSGKKSSLRRGFFWINNGDVCKQVRTTNEIPVGWVKGKINRRRTYLEIARGTRKEVGGTK